VELLPSLGRPYELLLRQYYQQLFIKLCQFHVHSVSGGTHGSCVKMYGISVLKKAQSKSDKSTEKYLNSDEK
jgi:hypothetical protein